jgi:hypothetical protein
MDNTAAQLSKFMLNAYLGKNWVEIDFKSVLADITLAEANTKIPPLNTIAAIVYHLDYYVTIVLKRLKGDMLRSNADNGFDIQTLSSVQAWRDLQEGFYMRAERFAAFVGLLDEKRLTEDFLDQTYGQNIYNIQGIIEHAYYHLGQIVLLKKMIRSGLFH